MGGPRLVVLILMGLATGFLIQAQQVPDKPLGDVAREQRDARKLSSKKASGKIYTNEDGASPKVAAESADAKPPSERATEAKPNETNNSGRQPGPADPTSQGPAQTNESIMDRVEDEHTTDVLIVPAGTRIKVDVSSLPYGPFPPVEGTVIVPVRVGFSMAIPARSKVTLASNPSTDGGAYVWVTVTTVTLGGANYEVHTNARQLPTSRGISELTFTLSEPLSIP